jgi:hypothetical protein
MNGRTEAVAIDVFDAPELGPGVSRGHQLGGGVTNCRDGNADEAGDPDLDVG